MRPVDNLYRESDKLVKKANYLTKLLVKLRDLPKILSCFHQRDCSIMRWNWRDCEIPITSIDNGEGFYKVFHLYTENQYRNIFNKLPGPAFIKLNGLDNSYFEPPGNIYDPREWYHDPNIEPRRRQQPIIIRE